MRRKGGCYGERRGNALGTCGRDVLWAEAGIMQRQSESFRGNISLEKQMRSRGMLRGDPRLTGSCPARMQALHPKNPGSVMGRTGRI